jgi:hypothetical protein
MTEAAETYQHPMVIPAGFSSTTVTLPDQYLCHYITDEQLDMLGMLENEPVREICLASAGALVGSLTPGIIGLVHLANEPENFTLADMISMLVLITATVLTVVTGLAWVMRAKAKPKLVATIRARPKVSVRISNDIIA